MLSIVMLSVIMLSVVILRVAFAQCRYAERRFTKRRSTFGEFYTSTQLPIGHAKKYFIKNSQSITFRSNRFILNIILGMVLRHSLL
jgi:hypothetical protein